MLRRQIINDCPDCGGTGYKSPPRRPGEPLFIGDRSVLCSTCKRLVKDLVKMVPALGDPDFMLLI